LIDFVFERYGSPLAEDDKLDETKAIVQEIAKKYGKADTNVHIEISSLSPKHPIFKFLSKLEWYLSKSSLERVLRIRDLLLRKQQESNLSLEEILGV
jgi:CDP-diacylglycerol pyrophosphatase